jgi:hypothetical protein
MEMASLVDVGSRVDRLEYRAGDQIPVVGESQRKYRLELLIDDVAIRLVEPVGVLLKLKGPDARNRVGELLVDLVERFVVGCLRRGMPRPSKARSAMRVNALAQ